jgi:taurine dioxygenase
MGAEITGLDLAKEDFKSRLIDDIRAVWLEHHLLVIRDQNLPPQRQLALARAIGEPDIYPFLDGLDGFPEITSVLKREDETVNFGGVWHTDTIYQDKPPMATMLQAIELPPIGGDTLFANQHLAWDRLSDGLQQTLSGLRVICTAGKAKVAASRTARIAEKGKAVDADAMQASHPVVRTHPETGRKSLYASPGHAIRFDGWTEEESAGLLAHLFRHQILPEFQCRLGWRVGDVAIWDNRCTLHYPLNDYHGHRRLLHRITLKGDRPV